MSFEEMIDALAKVADKLTDKQIDNLAVHTLSCYNTIVIPAARRDRCGGGQLIERLLRTSISAAGTAARTAVSAALQTNGVPQTPHVHGTRRRFLRPVLQK